VRNPLTPPPPVKPSPIRLAGPGATRGDWQFGMYVKVEEQAAKLMEQGYEPVGITFKDQWPVILIVIPKEER
jgi:hypothetical protein